MQSLIINRRYQEGEPERISQAITQAAEQTQIPGDPQVHALEFDASHYFKVLSNSRLAKLVGEMGVDIAQIQEALARDTNRAEEGKFICANTFRVRPNRGYDIDNEILRAASDIGQYTRRIVKISAIPQVLGVVPPGLDDLIPHAEMSFMTGLSERSIDLSWFSSDPMGGEAGRNNEQIIAGRFVRSLNAALGGYFMVGQASFAKG